MALIASKKKEETRMKLMKDKWFRAAKWMVAGLIGTAMAWMALAQPIITTTVQGTVYLADGTPGSGSVQLSWPAFSTANNQAVLAGRTTVTVGGDGFLSVNLAPNMGSSPAGLYYTVTYHMNDGTTNTEYWVVPAAAQASIAQVRSQVMPAAQAVQAVSKAYVDHAVQSINQSSLTSSGGSLTGPLYLNGDPSQALQAADKHYVDSTFAQAVPMSGGNMTGPLALQNHADAEIDYGLQPGLTSSQNGGFTYKDWDGSSQWNMVKDANNDWALNSGTGGLDSLKAYQSTNSGDTYINASKASGVVRVNYESGAGSAFNIYGGNSGTLYASLSGPTSIKFPGLSASSGNSCLQIDAAGLMTNTGTACGTGSGTVNSGISGQVAYYAGSGTAIGGLNAVPISAGGTGAGTAAGALLALAGASLATTDAQDFQGGVEAPTVDASLNGALYVKARPYLAACDGVKDDQTAIQAAFNDALTQNKPIQFPVGTCLTSTIVWKGQSFFGAGPALSFIKGQPGQDVFQGPDTAFSYPTGGSVRDLTILINTSVDASSTAAGGNGTFPYRISGMNGGTGALTNPPTVQAQVNPPAPGPVLYGSSISGSCAGSITAGSSTFTLPCAVFTYAPTFLVIGKQITINGAGASGGALTTTISSVISNTQVSIATPASTTTTTASGSWGGSNTAPWYFGNCGFVVPNSDGANTVSGFSSYRFSNLVFGYWGNTSQQAGSNHACGMFLQAQPYDIHFDKVDFDYLWGGYVEALPVAHAGSLFAWTPDTSIFNHMNFKFVNIPMVWYNGTHRFADALNFYGTQSNYHLGLFQFDTPGLYMGGFPSATIERFYSECSVGDSGEADRFSGRNNVIAGGEVNECVNSWVGWWASSSVSHAEYAGLHIGSAATGNTFLNTQIGPQNLIDNGTDNLIGTNTGAGAVGGRNFYANRPRDPVNKLDAGFLLSPNPTVPFTSGNDLLITCTEFNFAYTNSGGAAGCTSDPTGTEVTHNYVHLTKAAYPGTSVLGGPTAQGDGPLGKVLIVGDRLPQSKLLFVVQGRCDVSCTQNFSINDTTTSTALAAPNLTFGTTWTIQTISVDLSAIALGDKISVWLSTAFGGSATTEDISFMAFSPVTASVTSAFASPPALGSTTPAAVNGTTGTFSGIVQGSAGLYSVGAGQVRAWFNSGLAGTPLIIGQTDSTGDAQIHNQANGYINFDTNNTTRMTIAAGGTTTFASPVIVNGALTAANNPILTYFAGNSGSPFYFNQIDSTGNAQINNLANGYINFGTNNTTRMTIAANGTTTFSYPVNFSTLTSLGTIFTYYNAGLSATPLAIGQYDSTGNAIINNQANGGLQFSTNNTNRFSISASGLGTFTQTPQVGTTPVALVLSGTTGSIGGSSLSLGVCASGTVSITGATSSVGVIASPTTYPGDGMVWKAYVSSAGVVTVKVCAAVAGTPAASTYNVRVIQ